MLDQLFIAQNWHAAIRKSAMWTLAIGAMALASAELSFGYFFPDVWNNHSAGLRLYSFLTATVIGLPAFSLFFRMSLRLNQVNLQLQEIARRDVLTGLLNRKALTDQIRQRQNATVSPRAQEDALILIDIDHFKDVNDGFGHAAGDHVLRMVSVCIGGNVFERDYVARIGGEEFAVYLLDSGASGAVRAAERIRAAIEENKAHFEGENIRITASVGGALYPPGSSYQTIYRRADSALYRAKKSGRNRCEFNGLPKPGADPQQEFDIGDLSCDETEDWPEIRRSPSTSR
ncbi:GGDEF domain-containing protein [Oricola cellulosilytica]|nr:GGDEF domain-containing protein [Oricola cellulosilytica]